MFEQVGYVAVFGGIVVAAVLGLVLHEFAHAVPILVAGRETHVTIGSDDGRTVNLGPIGFTVGYDGLYLLTTYGHYDPTDVDSTAVLAVAAIAGPLMTVAIAGLYGTLIYRGVEGPLRLACWLLLANELYRAWQTIVPKTYSGGPYDGWESDGKRFLRHVRS